MNPRIVFVAAALMWIISAASVPALAAPPEAPQPGSVSAEAAPAQAVPVIDGSVLDDKAWATAKVITGFWQTTPDEGQPASENTEVRVLYTATALYIGVVNYDRSPEEIISSESRRDASLTNTDSFLVILDTFRDRQNGFVFGTSPAGIEYDGQVITVRAGGTWLQPPKIKHTVLDYSDDCELLEIVLPAEFKTVELE